MIFNRKKTRRGEIIKVEDFVLGCIVVLGMTQRLCLYHQSRDPLHRERRKPQKPTDRLQSVWYLGSGCGGGRGGGGGGGGSVICKCK